MMKATFMTLMTGSTTSCPTRTSAPTNTAFIAVASTVPIIAPFGIFTAKLTDTSRDLTIIQGHGFPAGAMAGDIDWDLGWGALGPRSRAFAILRGALGYRKGIEKCRAKDDGGYGSQT